MFIVLPRPGAPCLRGRLSSTLGLANARLPETGVHLSTKCLQLFLGGGALPVPGLVTYAWHEARLVC